MGGPHIFETCPSGNYFEYFAMAIGGRSTSAKTYLEKHFESFDGMDVEALIKHALEAMNKTTPSDQSLSTKNTSVVVTSTQDPYREVPAEDLQKAIDQLEKKEAEPDVPMEDAPAADGATPMET